MGNIADYYLEECSWFKPSPPSDVTCKRCGAEGLTWAYIGKRWRLAGDDGPHTCRPSADDFEVLG